jgi:hypothetical protein
MNLCLTTMLTTFISNLAQNIRHRSRKYRSLNDVIPAGCPARHGYSSADLLCVTEYIYLAKGEPIKEGGGKFEIRLPWGLAGARVSESGHRLRGF